MTFSSARRVLAGIGVCALVVVGSAVPSHAGAVVQADVSVTKTDGTSSVTAGTMVTYTITVSNSGPSAAEPSVVDPLPAVLTGVTWTCTPGANAACLSGSGSGNLSTGATLPIGTSVTYTVTGTLDCAATGSLANTATATLPLNQDPDPSDNSAIDTDTIIPATCPPPSTISTVVVDKVVEGTQPEGTQYTISLDCVAENDPPDPQEVVIDGPGNVFTHAVSTTPAGQTCTVAEPDDGGATSVTVSCVATGDAVCEADNRVAFPDQSEDEGTITVTNTFEEPTPPTTPEPAAETAPAAAAIVTVPGFTG